MVTSKKMGFEMWLDERESRGTSGYSGSRGYEGEQEALGQLRVIEISKNTFEITLISIYSKVRHHSV